MDFVQKALTQKHIFIIRWFSFVAGLTHWSWYYFYLFNHPNLKDYLSARIVLSIYGLLIFALTFKEISIKKLKSLYHVGIFLYISYESFLYLSNEANGYFRFSFIGLSVILLSATLSFKMFLVIAAYILFCPGVFYLLNIYPINLTEVINWYATVPAILLVLGYLIYSQHKHYYELTKLFELNQKNSQDLILGQLSTAMSHEINNPLTIIIGRIKTAQKGLSQIEDLKIKQNINNDLEKIFNASERIKRVIQSMKFIAKADEHEEVAYLRMSDVVSRVLDTTTEKIKSLGIEIQFIDKSNQKFCAQPADLAQVVLNLILFSIENVSSEELKQISILSYDKINHVVIEIRDSGRTIAKDFKSQFNGNDFNFIDRVEISPSFGFALLNSKKHVMRFGGKIIITPELDNCFELSFPFAKS